MAKEIERKFLVTKSPWTNSTRYTDIMQGYLNNDGSVVVRVRWQTQEDDPSKHRGFLTIKGNHSGITRDEYEYEIPGSEAVKILNTLAKHTLVKRRWFIAHAGHWWHVDEFGGDNKGLILAEIELSSHEEIWLQPDWCGEEVSYDFRYTNYNLAVTPRQHW